MYRIAKFLLFLFKPEKAHHITFFFLRIPGLSKILGFNAADSHPLLKRTVFGLEFRNPVGLAAGLDKDAIAFEELGDLGFGFIEIGTLTPKAQPGNDKPRLFRLVEDEALINRMGFNNEGVESAVKRLKNRKNKNLIIGGNIGKNKITSNEEVEKDYVECFNALFEVVDYFVVNVSSPNTPNLRELQEKEPLSRLLDTLQSQNKLRSQPKPILLKIAPDLNNEQLDDIISIVKTTGIAGIIATNTTISREGLLCAASKLSEIGMGGLSGKPLRQRSTDIIRYLKEKSNNAFPIIGVGGIHSVEDAMEKLEAGADLIQLYTGFIYEGPALIKKINQKIISLK